MSKQNIQSKTGVKNYSTLFPLLILNLSLNLFMVQDVKAFSLDSIFLNKKIESFGNGNNGNSRSQSGVENLQSLKVFETNKAFAQDFEDEVQKNIESSKNTDDITSFDLSSIKGEEGLDLESHTENTIYTVQKGESIYSIASYLGINVETIVGFNDLKSKEVEEGDVLEIPPVSGVMYVIKKGDTLESISKKFDVSSDDISLFNGFSSKDDLTAGEKIFIPGGKESEETVKVKDIKKKVNKEEKDKKESKKDIKNITKEIKSSKNFIKSAADKIVVRRGATSQFNTKGSIQKYSNLPKYSGYYAFPSPGSVQTQKMHGHNGVDFAAPVGTRILAAASGVVKVARADGYNFGYGKYIIVEHANGTETLYAHLSQVLVTTGQSVGRGELIGKMGSSGNSTGSHLHFEIRGGYNPWAW